jgi:hypothetical protein
MMMMMMMISILNISFTNNDVTYFSCYSDFHFIGQSEEEFNIFCNIPFRLKRKQMLGYNNVSQRV